MVSSVLAGVLESYLGQYLELSDTSISVGSEIRLKNVQLKESALSDLGLPVTCVHGKVKRLVIKIPWFQLFTKKTTIEVEGLHLLVVPSTSVKYDEKKERREQNEAKQQRLQRIEDAKKMQLTEEDKGGGVDQNNSSFAERLAANIIKNLEVTITKVHIRYEDKQPNTGRYPFAAGVTLDRLAMSTSHDDDEGSENDADVKLKVFGKHVVLESFAVYWRPKATLFSEDSKAKDEVIDLMFESNIGTRQKPVSKLKYLLGPISSDATMKWCPNPALFDFTIPQIDLGITMDELCLSLTKYQYQDFVMLLQSFEFLHRAAKFRKYKARHNLENVPNYVGRLRDLWKFAFDCVYEEEIMRRINNWSWEHMKAHLNRCKQYRRLYLQLLSTAKPSPELKKDLRRFEDALDEVNIRIQRQLAEREVEKKELELKRKKQEAAKGGFWGWWAGSSSGAASEDGEDGATPHGGKAAIKILENALSSEEKAKLYEVIDFQENAHHGIYPKRFLAKKLSFKLDNLLITIRDDDLSDSVVIRLDLESVSCHISQRPSADYLALKMTMNKLTVEGMRASKKDAVPMIVETKPQEGESGGRHLLNFSFENNPPENPNGDLDSDKGSLYDQRIRFFSSPLEVVFDSKTFNRLAGIFRTPDELNLSNLQHTAASKLRQYKEATTLGLQYAIDNHNLVDIDVKLMSSNIVIPHQGKLTGNCACVVANLGSIHVKSKPISVETKSLKELSLSDLSESFKNSLRDQAYDNFSVSLENMQLIVALAGEDWRSHVSKVKSPLFILNPTSLRVVFQYCLIKNDPDMPLAKVKGSLESIFINISDYRFIKLAQVIDSLLDADSEDGTTLHRTESEASMASAMSSLANSGSLVHSTASMTVGELAPVKKRNDSVDADAGQEQTAHMTKFVLDFQIDTVHLSLTQLSKDSNADQKLFHFTLEKMSAKAVVRTYDLSGTFNIGGVNCEHLLLQTPSGDPVHILATNSHLGAAEAAVENAKELLSVVYTDVNKNSPEFQTVHQSVLKRLDIKLSSVQINCHQDAILDLVAKITKFINEVSSKAKNLMAAGPEEKHHLSSGEDVPDPESLNTTVSFRQSTTRQPSPWRTNRKISMKTTSNLSRWAFRAKKKAASLQREIVEVKIVASLESVTCDFMTSCVHFAELQVKDLQATYEQTKTKKTITSKLVNFQIHDALNRDPENIKTLYEKIAESMDQKVFDAQVVLYDHTLEAKAGNPDLVDVEVDVKMGRVKLVFLMKFITDFLTFLEPFSGAKEIVAEQASNALEEAAKSMIDAYANSTRAKLNILMDAPIIIIPVHSKSMSTLIADLGTLKICNRFKIEGKNIFDELHIRLENLQLERAKIDENVRCNDILASTVIVHPITFELDVRRNMNGAMKEDDPAELLVKGTLYQIILETSKEDYNVLLAILQNNFSEKGEFELLGPKIKKTAAGGTPSTTKDRTSLMLPLKNKHSSGSRTSLSSERSIKSLRSAMKVPERDPDARVVEFSFQFRGFKATLHTGVTDMTANHETRDPANALAEFTIKVLSVKGHVLVSSAISADAYLQNCVLEDCRHHDDLNPDPNRIIRLMEAKSTSTSEKKDKKAKMIDIHYERDELGSQKIDVNIYSFVLVGSVPYLLEIANFFIPDEQMNYEWKKESRTSKTGTEVSAAEENEEASKLQVFLKIDEPDIFLVENIQDINSDALMLNMELQLKYWCTSNSMSMMASLANIRCHTCRFNPKDREKTMAQILQPCTLSFTISKTDGHGNRVNVNMSDLCLNISPHSIAIMQKSVEAFIASMATSDPAESKEEKNHEEDWSTLWQIREFQDDEFWFLRPDDSVDALDTLTSFGSTQSLAADEQAMININNLVVKMESGVGNNTIPLILLESSLSCDIRNWSTSRMNALGSINLEVAYYNSAIALWEPVIEPVCQINPKDGSVIKKKWGLNITVQSNSANDFGSAFVSPSYDEADGILCTENMLPLMMIALQSRDILEVTVTKSFLSVLNTLTQSFSDVTDSARKSLPTAPFIIQNHTGKPMTLLLDTKGFKYYEKHEKPGQKSQVELAHGKSVNLFLFKDRSSFNQSFDYVSPLQEQTEQAEASLRLRVGGESGIFEIPVSKADKRFFPFRFRGDEMGDNHGMVSEVSVDNGCKYITLRSIIQVKNHFDRVVNVFTYDGVAKYDKLTSLKPDDSFNVPLGNVYASPYEFYFMVEGQGQNMGLECFPYRELYTNPTFSQQITCTNKNNDKCVYLNVVGSKEEIFHERSGKLSDVTYVLDIRPLLVLKNCLPTTLHYCINGDDCMQFIDPGQNAHLQGVALGKTEIKLKVFEFRQLDWECVQVVEHHMQELSFWRFTSKDSSGSHLKLDLGINSALSLGTQVLSIYAPFWLINKTGKMLTYRGQDPQNIVYHPKELEDVPMMFSYTTKSFLGNRKASLRVEDASWSDPFTLDTIKDAGKVVCKRAGNNTGGKHRSLNVGVNINMSQSSLTKIITFTSYYVILNTAEFSISVRELAGSEDGGSCGDLLEVPPGTCIPFWPTTASSKVEACVTDTPEFSAPISLHSTHTTLLMLDNKYGALFCELKTSNSEILLSFSSYIKGLAPVLLINTTRREYIEFGEKGNDVRELLGPGQSKLYTWQDPTGSRTLSWAISGYHCEHTNNLVSDQSVGIIQLDNDVELAWVSFLDGMQRVLLFTEDRNLCFKLAHSTGENERIEWELDVSIHGIGISVVNNAPNCSKEFLYTSITSSDIVWEIRRNGKSRYKSLTRAQCEALEADFQLYMREKTVGKRTSDQRKINVEGSKSQLHVDYDLSRMIQPTEGKIRRQFQKGLWLQVRTSAHQRQIHVKIHRIQVDNQLRACLFPVIMAPVPPPKSVLANSIPKPFIEISVLEYMTPEHTNLRQYKYLKALVQELHIKIDQGLLNAVSDLFEEEELLDEDITTFLNQDLSLARKPLRDIVKLQVTKGHKDFFDNLHLSPLKVHVSFSLTSYKSSKTNRRSNFFGLFLQSLGVTITDTDDIIFRLAYFERKHQFYSKEDLVDEMIHHYTSQAIKQAYVFIFGLDVIGNPLGLVVGVSRSVEDLFYEPFQGAVEGPSEFAEGLVIGVRSVFSGVVGGAAGTVSRITGALGKGLASLTFDEKFQNKRREAIKKRGRQTFGESFARGGKGLVMGFFDGVTGVAVKPVEGAMEEGVGGFFKGVSKGMVGLVARPTVGIVDFASGTFDSVKRVTEVTGEVSRVRPARFLHPDGVVRNYNLNEANGNKIMNDLEKGRYAESDNYVIHEIIQTTDKPSVFLVTSKRVLYVVFNQVLGSWSIDWEYLYNDITGPPPVGAESNNTVWYIVIKPKEERRRGVFGLFGGGESGRKVYVHSRNGAQNLARIIENLRTEKN